MKDKQHNAGPEPRRSQRTREARTAEFLVRFAPDEKDRVDWAALAVHQSVVNYIRSVGLRQRPRAWQDRALIHDVLGVHADVGRLGGLLKMWLAGEAAVACHDRGHVRRVLVEVEDAQKCLQHAATQVWQRRTARAVPLGEPWTPKEVPAPRGKRRSIRVRVPVSPQEKSAIIAAAADTTASAAPLPPAVYLRTRALHYRPATTAGSPFYGPPRRRRFRADLLDLYLRDPAASMRKFQREE